VPVPAIKYYLRLAQAQESARRFDAAEDGPDR
jgi:hypothetical protein